MCHETICSLVSEIHVTMPATDFIRAKRKMRIMTQGPRSGVLRALTLATGLIAALCLPLTAKEKKPSAKQLASFRAAKTVRIVIDKKVKGKINDSMVQFQRQHIENGVLSFIQSLGLQIVEKDADITLKIDKIRVDRKSSRREGDSEGSVFLPGGGGVPSSRDLQDHPEPDPTRRGTDSDARGTMYEFPELPESSSVGVRKRPRGYGYWQSTCRISLKSRGVRDFDVRYQTEGHPLAGHFNNFDSTLSLLLQSIWPLREGDVRPTGVVVEPKTGLRWTYEDNGYDVSWLGADSYCATLSTGGYDCWRLPTIEELEQLDSRLVRITARYVWSSTKVGSASALNFDFEAGATGSNFVSDSSWRGALCVCSSKE